MVFYIAESTDSLSGQILLQIPTDLAYTLYVQQYSTIFFTFILRTSIKNQMDPNNVSGLLKLHLRENHILSSQVVAAVKEELKSVSEQELVSIHVQTASLTQR